MATERIASRNPSWSCIASFDVGGGAGKGGDDGDDLLGDPRDDFVRLFEGANQVEALGCCDRLLPGGSLRDSGFLEHPVSSGGHPSWRG